MLRHASRALLQLGGRAPGITRLTPPGAPALLVRQPGGL